MKLVLIGYGYWGKIISNNLSEIGVSFQVHDPAQGYVVDDETLQRAEKVIVATPASTHHQVLKHVLASKRSVFCEKPLCVSLLETREVFAWLKQSGSKLQVDWVFTFHPSIVEMKRLFRSGVYGDVREVHGIRINDGPVRFDVGAKWDLLSHDVSILLYLFSVQPNRVFIEEKVLGPNIAVNDTCTARLSFEQFEATLHSSWSYAGKFRRLTFLTSQGVLEWFELDNILTWNGSIVPLPNFQPPLRTSLERFLTDDFGEDELSLKIAEVLDGTSATV